AYVEFMRNLCDRFRKEYDYTIIDTRGGYDSTSAVPALLADGYVVVLEADQISVEQVHGLKKNIEEWGVQHQALPALIGFIVKKATFSVEEKSFPESLVSLYGGAHFGTIPLDREAVRAYQQRQIPTKLTPDCDFAYYSFQTIERLISP